MKLTKLEEVSIRKVLSNRITEGIDNRSIDVKIKKENGTYWLFLQHDNDEEENITNTGFDTIELARHSARMKGFNIVDDKGDKQEDSFNKRPDSMTPPKPTKREKTPKTEKPKEIDLGKEKEIKLESKLHESNEILYNRLFKAVHNNQIGYKNGKWIVLVSKPVKIAGRNYVNTNYTDKGVSHFVDAANRLKLKPKDVYNKFTDYNNKGGVETSKSYEDWISESNNNYSIEEEIKDIIRNEILLMKEHLNISKKKR